MIDVTKTASPTSVPETGGPVTFTFVVDNDGDEDFTLTSLNDSVFGDLNGQGTCVTGGVIAVGGSYSCALTVTLSDDDLDDHVNTVTASGTDNEGTTVDDTDDETVTFTDVPPVIDVTKTASPTSVPETGGPVTFTFVVDNDGDEDFTLTSLNDSVFGDLNGQGTCVTGGVIAVGGSYSCALTVTLSDDDLDDHVNTVTASGTDNEGTTVDDTDDETVTFTNVNPTITVDKTANPTTLPEPGGDVTFTIVVTNISPVETVTLTDLDDNRFGDLLSDTVPLTGGASATSCNDPVSAITIAAGGTFTCTVTASITGNAGVTHNNIVTAIAVDDDPGSTPATANDDADVEFTDVDPAIVVTKVANPTELPEPGGDVTFTIVVANVSPDETVTLTDLFDNRFGDLLSDTVPLTGGASATSCNDPVSAITIGAGGTYECTVAATLAGNAGDSHVNVVTAIAADNDGNTDSDDATETVTFTNVDPSIVVTKVANPTELPEPGGDVTFTIVVANVSPDETVTLTDLFDNRFGDLLSDTVPLTGGASATSCNDPVSAITIGAGGSYECTVAATLVGDFGEPHVNVVSAIAVDDEGNSDSDDATETVTFTDVAPEIDVTKTASVSSLPETGGPVTFTFRVTNTGVEDVTVTSIVDDEFGDLLATAELQNGGVPVVILAEDPDAFYEFTYATTLASDLLTDHVNRVDVIAVDDENTPATDFDTETVTFTDVAPEIDVTKTASVSSLPETGGPVTFTFRVTNTGVEDVTVTSIVDDEFGDLLATAELQNGGVPVVILAEDPDAFYEFTYATTLASDLLTDHVNRVDVIAVDDENTPATDFDTETVTFTDVAPEIDVTKTASVSSLPETGGPVTFTFRVTNTGVEDVTVTSIVDDEFGDLLATAELQNGGVPVVILAEDPDAFYEFTYATTLASDLLTDHVNRVDVIAVDDENTPATDFDTETVTFTDVAPEIDVTKTASVSSLPETGGPVTFTFRVTNTGVEDVTVTSIVDDEFGDLLATAELQNGGVPVVILAEDPDAFYEFTYATTLASDLLTDHVNRVDVIAVDDENTPATDFDTETVTFTDVAPEIDVTKTASVSSLPETGGPVTFTFRVTNTGVEDVTVTSIVDDEFGDLLATAELQNGGVPVVILAEDPDAFYEFTYATTLASDLLTDHVNRVDVIAVDDENTPATDFDTETVTFTDVAPEIDVTKTASVSSLPETGGPVTFTFRVTNTGVEDVTVTSIVDDEFGDLLATAELQNGGVPVVILAEDPDAFYEFTYATTLASDLLTDHVNRVDVIAVDDENTPATDFDTETVTFTDVAPEIDVTKTASVSSLPETGGPVTFTFRVTNTGVEDVTVTSIVDDEFGDLLATAELQNGGVPVVILAEDPDAFYEFTYATTLASDLLTDHVNRVDVIAVDDENTPATDFDTETVTFTDVAPEIDVTKTASVSSLPETGGPVTFTFRVTNTGVEDVTVTSIVDDEFGDLLATAELQNGGVPVVILAEDPDAFYEFTYATTLASDLLTDHVNRVDVIAVDDENTPATDFDTETVTFTDVAPEIDVTKTASVSSLPETGGPVTFTFRVTNTGVEDVTVTSIVDDEFGDLLATAELQNGGVPVVILAEDPDAFYEFTYATTLASDLLTDHVNRVDVIAVDDENTPATDFDTETVTFTDVAPEIDVTKTASVSSLPETGGPVTFTFRVTNTGVEDVTVTSLTDTVFGDLNGQGTCATGGLIPVGDSYTCELTVTLSGDAGNPHVNSVTAIAVDDEGTTDDDSDDETVTFSDSPPVIDVTKTADPTSVPETGGPVTFTFRVTNTGVEDVTVTSLTDTVFGDLNGQGTCATGGLIPVGDSYTCELTVTLSGDAGNPHVNSVTAIAVDDEGTTDDDSDDETVTFSDSPPVIDVTKTAVGFVVA